MAMTEKELDEILSKLPSKVQKNRKRHIVVKDSSKERQIIEANTRTIPGIITNRGCAYAGCKGVVLGPIKDMLHIVHGPVGCSYYAWNTRRNKAKNPADPAKNFINYCFTTDMQEQDIVFGGEKKLAQMIDEVVEIFHPPAITISATCPVGLIGDDLAAVAKAAEKKHGIQVLAFNCEGYKGVSQSAGHHIANNGLMEHVIGTGEKKEFSTYAINILGEYNIGGDSWEIERILKEIGYEVIAVLSGDAEYKDIQHAHMAELNLVQCHRSINYIAEMLEIKYGTPWLKVNFIGIESTCKSLRDIALYFGDEELIKKTEEVIAKEKARIEPIMDQYRKVTQGKTAFAVVGGSRGHHYQLLFQDLGMETVVAGYEFAHRDDYEGRHVIPEIKVDADSKNIPELHVEPDPQRFRLKMSPEKLEELKKKIPLSYYAGMYPDMKDGAIIVDDFNHFETEELIKALKPDLFCSGIKDKYVVQKWGIPSKQLHSYDYSGPYAGFNGAVNFARDVANSFTNPSWNYITPPWKQ